MPLYAEARVLPVGLLFASATEALHRGIDLPFRQPKPHLPKCRSPSNASLTSALFACLFPIHIEVL
jgi:hypothetical protein